MGIRKKNTDTNFFANIYDVVRLIPKGKVTSYGTIAHYLGTKLSARMVGWALRVCPHDVPAHRVVNQQGLLTGKHHFNPPSKMQSLLEDEGIKISNDQIVNFNDAFWNPSEEL